MKMDKNAKMILLLNLMGKEMLTEKIVALVTEETIDKIIQENGLEEFVKEAEKDS